MNLEILYQPNRYDKLIKKIVAKLYYMLYMYMHNIVSNHLFDVQNTMAFLILLL